MGRRIVAERPEGAARPPLDLYYDRVLKYIPADVVGAWVSVTGIVSSVSPKPPVAVLWIAMVVGTIVTGLWTWRQTTVPEKKPAITQILLSTVAFVIWVSALGDPFTSVPGFERYMGALALIAYTLLVGAIRPKESLFRRT